MSDYKYEGMPEEDRNALTPAFKRTGRTLPESDHFVRWLGQIQDLKCNLCGATSQADNIPDASKWITNHGCSYGKTAQESSAEEQEEENWSSLDEGRSDGQGESYAERQ